MTLRLQLVIEGDAKGAKQALNETSEGVDKLGKSAGAASENTKKLAENTGDAAGKLGEVGRGSDSASKGIEKMGSTAVVASGGISAFGGALGRIAGLVGGTIVGGVIGGVIGVGIAAISEATQSWFGTLTGSASTGAEEALKRHKELIGGIAGAYSAAARGVEDYGRRSATIMRFEAQRNVARLEHTLRASPEIRRTSDFTGQTGAVSFGGLTDAESLKAEPFLDAIERFNKGVRSGAPDAQRFREEVAAIASALETSSPYQQTADRLLEFTKQAADVQSDLAQAKDALAGIEGASEATARALGGLPKGFEASGMAAARSAESIAKFNDELSKLVGDGFPQGVSGSIAGAAGTRPAQFAAGGIVDRPTFFRYGRGDLGLMGEAGPEAILPLNAAGAVGAIGPAGREFSLSLARLGSGKLGVKAFADGGIIGNAITGLEQFTRAALSGVPATEALSNAVLGLTQQFLNGAISDLFSTIFPAGGANLFSGFARGGVIAGRSAFAMPAAPTPLRRFSDGGTFSGRGFASPLAATSSGAAATVSISILNTIDASGADPTTVARIVAELGKLKAELPTMIVQTMRQADSRRMS